MRCCHESRNNGGECFEKYSAVVGRIQKAFLLLVWSIAVQAQPNAVGIQLSQRAVRDWREGERMSLEASTRIELTPRLGWRRWQLQPRLRLTYGLQYLDMGDTLPALVLPSDNELRAELTGTYTAGWKLDPFISAGVTTAVGSSYRLQNLRRIETARWGDPIVIHQTAGVGYGGGTALHAPMGGTLRDALEAYPGSPLYPAHG